MINVNNLSVVYSTKTLFKDVNLKFVKDNCYGIIGANGAGKSTFLNILSGDDDSTSGEIIYEKGMRISTLKQDHFQFDDMSVLNTVISGYEELYNIQQEKDAIYQKPDFSEEDGIKAAHLEEKFSTLGGWEAETEVCKLLDGLHLENNDYYTEMKNLEDTDKVKVLLARALFGTPDVLILDEPTNHLDFAAIKWLEEFIINFDQTVIVVSHDRHFLNNVCTYIVDIDYQKAKLYAGNYEFWRESSQLAQELMSKSNKAKEEQIQELKDFIARFSANASKSKQATSRKKMLDKITLDDISPSSRQYPYINIETNRDIGTDVVRVEKISLKNDSISFKNISFNVEGHDKVAFISRDQNLVTAVFEILSDNIKQDSGDISWGITVEKDYFPKDYTEYFKDDKINLIDWLRLYSPNQEDAFIRGFLGRMLFSQDEPLKKVKILSGGEKMRMMFSKIMIQNGNVQIMDQPTNHLDLESIHAVNEGLIKFKGSLLFTSHDLKFIESLATKIVEITPNGSFEYNGTFEDYLDDDKVQAKIDLLYKGE
ncbi:MAG: ABC-F family ATP-binding cassette domain-containing protein [Mycoplasmatales bacterium]